MAPSVASSAVAGPSNWNRASSKATSSRRSRSQSFSPASNYSPAQPRPSNLRVKFSDESAGPSMARESDEDSSPVSPRTRPLDPTGSNSSAIQFPPILKVRSSESAAAAAAARDISSSEPFNTSFTSFPCVPRNPSEPSYDTPSFPHHLRIISASPTESDPPEIESPLARRPKFSFSDALAKFIAQRTRVEKKTMKKSDGVESLEIEVEEKEEELPSFIMMNGIRIFVDKNRHDKDRRRRASRGSSAKRSSADRKGKGKASRPSSASLNSKTSTSSHLKPIDSLITVNEMEEHPCTPGDYTKYRERDFDDLRDLYVAMRKEGFDMPYAPFEPEYVAMKYYTAEPQSYILQVSFLGSFVCWWIAIGGILSYRIWGIHVGYSKEWHWASIHQDLRFDDREWKLFVGSAGVLVVSFAVVTVACLWGFGEKWWRDLIALGLFKVCQVLKQWKRKVDFRRRSAEALGKEGRGESEGKKQNEGRSAWEWDLDWEEDMVLTYRKRIWMWVTLSFLLLPAVLASAYIAVLLQKDKCYAHDKTGGFGWR
ncbi:hypothetical protein EV426DRAFT_215797 [Tirmania nivea]|nr:hypothetical protein EV426DRAFT_215797 [Tirmania nivea]